MNTKLNAAARLVGSSVPGAPAFECTDPLRTYVVEGDQVINFIKRKNGELVHPGTTNETLLAVLIDRTKGLDNKFPCPENKAAIEHMQAALDALNSRTAKRVAQGVETRALPHVS